MPSRNQPQSRDIFKVLQAFALAISAGAICSYLGIPVGWLVGPLLMGISLAFAQGTPRPLPSVFLTVGKAIIGVYAASRFSPDTLLFFKAYALPLLLCISITATLSTANGFFLWRVGGIDRVSSFLGTIPGSASTIVAMSEDLGADPVIVAILQYTRMMLVALSMPMVANWLASFSHLGAGLEPPSEVVTAIGHGAGAISLPLWSNVLFLIGCCSLGAFLGRKLKLPSPAFLGSFLCGIVIFWTLPDQFAVPKIAFTIALLLVGLSVGLRFSWQVIKKIWHIVLLEVGLIFGLILACFGIGYIFHRITDVDVMTALLGFVPGALEAMIATVTQLGGDTGVVLALQLTRQFLILFVINILYISIPRKSTKEAEQKGGET